MLNGIRFEAVGVCQGHTITHTIVTSCVKTTRGYLPACSHPTFVKWHDLNFHSEILLQLANSFIGLLQLGQFPLLTVNTYACGTGKV